MRKLTLACLTAASFAGSTTFAVTLAACPAGDVIVDTATEQASYDYDETQRRRERRGPGLLMPATEDAEQRVLAAIRCNSLRFVQLQFVRFVWRRQRLVRLRRRLHARRRAGLGMQPVQRRRLDRNGLHHNNVPLSQAYNDLLSFNDVPDNVNLNQQWFYVEKTVDGSCGCDLGGRIDVVYGTDAQKTQAFGNPNAGVRGDGFFDASWDHGEYGLAMPQLYGEVAYDDLAVKVGHFFTPMGYEVIPATGNFFYTHSYTMFNSEPFTHTGVLATYTGYEDLTLYGGWTLGWDTGFDQLNSGSNFLGGFSAELDDNVTFTYICTAGNFGWRDGGRATATTTASCSSPT